MKYLLLGLCIFFAALGVYVLNDVNKNPVYYVLVGPPGAGKGTLALKLAKEEGIPVITASSVLKKNMTPGSEVQELMSAGKFVPDSLVMSLLAKELEGSQYAKGAIFDGFPRTIAQSEFFAQVGIQVDLMIVLEIEDAKIVERMGGRRIHLPSGRMYHIDHMPPKVPGKDDETGEPLAQREDDRADIVEARLKDYHKLTFPIVAWAKKQVDNPQGVVKNMVFVDASQSFDQVWETLCQQQKALDGPMTSC
ncbi:adenylate kinase family protein [Candidatus Synchoanobacter obligatus]|uniref:Adenylate kinase n=1 Tax=Candidatus Synchoanobacter obligatus TaxID=2919597 RepID=A0ABT1L5Y4_9GAMM|nr:nucleoside monophosphate kinase [Candidatus Synchoanobacter obligatus]MCP8352140.1 nucleoside monophosphate kinase [Candidatus Synchoanobacter obligatus]